MFYPDILQTSNTRHNDKLFTSFLTFTLLASFILLSLMTSTLAAESKPESLTKVYKVVGADGSISYSDHPKENSETLMIAPIPTVPAIMPIHTNKADDNTADKPKSRYFSLSILAPANDSAFYSGSGEVDIILDIQPPLYDDDQIQLFLDGQLIKNDNQAQSRLQTVSRGSHTLQVKLISPSGEVYKEASSMFTVHRPSIRN